MLGLGRRVKPLHNQFCHSEAYQFLCNSAASSAPPMPQLKENSAGTPQASSSEPEWTQHTRTRFSIRPSLLSPLYSVSNSGAVAHMHVHAYTHTHTHTQTQTHTHTHTHTNTHTHTHTHTHAHTHARTHAHTHRTHTHTYAYTHHASYKHAHNAAHTHTQTCNLCDL